MDFVKYKNWLAHAEGSRSKYKGGFVNGKNTPAYNHDYYIHNKQKWKKNGRIADHLGDEDKWRLAKKAIEARTGKEYTPEDEQEFWVAMEEEYGNQWAGLTPEEKTKIYNKAMGRDDPNVQYAEAPHNVNVEFEPTNKHGSRPHGRKRGDTIASGDVHLQTDNSGYVKETYHNPKYPRATWAINYASPLNRRERRGEAIDKKEAAKKRQEQYLKEKKARQEEKRKRKEQEEIYDNLRKKKR